MTDIEIAICTFRNPHIADTLRSLSQLQLPPDTHIRIIVADNDDTPRARAAIELTARKYDLTCTYIHAPARNISMARNACLAAATASLLVFIDDDELATPELLVTQESSGADIVLGPVQAVYATEAPQWMQHGDFHSTRPVWLNNEIVTGYTGNVLMQRLRPALRGLRFRNDLGRSGGEDTLFFTAAHKAGARFAFAPDAVLTENVPPERATALWLLKRRFRFGQIHAMTIIEKGKSRLLRIASSFAKIVYCLIMAMIFTARTERMMFWLLRASLHAGIACRLAGIKPNAYYGRK